MGLEIRFTTGDITPAEIDVLLLLLHRLDNRNAKSDDVMSKLKSMASDAVPVVHESAPVESSVVVPLAPPAPVSISAPVAPITATPVATSEPIAVASDPNERDADGVVWDARIHSGNHKKAASGKWMRRKGVSEQTFQHVLAELRASAPAPVVTQPMQVQHTQIAPAAPVATQLDPATVFAPPVPAAPPVAPVAPPSNVVPMPVAAPVAPPVAPAPVTGAPVTSGVDFPTIMGKISEMTAAGKKPMELLANIGIANATALIGSQPERDRAMAHLLAN